MRKILLVLCAIEALVLATPVYAAARAHEGTAAGEGQASEIEALREAAIKTQNGDFQGVAEILGPVTSDPTFSLLSEQQQHWAYRLLGTAYVETKKDKEAIPLLKRATASEWATGIDWYLLLLVTYPLDDKSDAIESLTKLAQNWRETLSQLSDDAILHLVTEAAKGPEDRERALLVALANANWHAKDPFLSADKLYIELARLYLSDDNLTDALAASAALSDPQSVIEIRSDKRFDALVRADPARFDMDRITARLLAEAKTKAAAAPDKLAGVTAVAGLLFKTNRAAEALPLLEDAIARANSADGKPSPFTDTSDQLIWTMNLQSGVLLTLGRNDEAVAALKHAARRPEHGQMNVSQTINLADLYDELGRPTDALDAVADLDSAPMSKYGAMALADARACAYAQLNDTANISKTLSYMKSHASDGMRPLLNASLCANDLDGAAELVIAELEAPERRMAMLALLQDYTTPPYRSAFGGAQHSRLQAVRARSDVQTEIAKVGRIQSFALLPSYY